MASVHPNCQLQIKQEPYTDFSKNAAMDDDADTNAEDGDNGNGTEDTKPQVDFNGDEDVTLSQLIAENQRLQGLFQKMNHRQSVLEEFIEVEYGENFDKFLKNRERLVNVMGLEQTETSSDSKFDGKRSDKSYELVNLLKVVKDQAATYNEVPSATSNSTTSHFPSHQQSGSSPYESGRGKWNKKQNRGGRWSRGRH